jgi:hypothetical protein
MMLQLAIYDKMHICSIDTVAAFLIKPLYIVLPALVAKACRLDPKIMYRVKKYIYGLPNAGGAYCIAYRVHLITSGYAMTNSDPCLFARLMPEQGIRTMSGFMLMRQ